MNILLYPFSLFINYLGSHNPFKGSGSSQIDTLPDSGWKKINYFTTINGHHVSVATQSGNIIIKEKQPWER